MRTHFGTRPGPIGSPAPSRARMAGRSSPPMTSEPRRVDRRARLAVQPRPAGNTSIGVVAGGCSPDSQKTVGAGFLGHAGKRTFRATPGTLRRVNTDVVEPTPRQWPDDLLRRAREGRWTWSRDSQKSAPDGWYNGGRGRGPRGPRRCPTSRAYSLPSIRATQRPPSSSCRWSTKSCVVWPPRSSAHEKPGQTLQATALVHEAYLRLVGSQAQHWDSRGHFFAAAAEAMRRILLNRARDKKRQKRSWRTTAARLRTNRDRPEDAGGGSDRRRRGDRAARALDQPCADLVKLRFFAGLTLAEAADSLGIARRTADRHWAYARAWLYDYLSQEDV